MIFLRTLFRRLENLLRIDLRYAISGGFFLTATQVSSAVVALGLTIAFANLLPVETYGMYRYVISVYGLLTIAALPGIDTAIIQAVSNGNDAAFGEGLRAKLRWGLLGTGAALILAGYEFYTGSEVLGKVFILAAIALPFMESFSVYSAFLNGKKRYKEWAGIDIMTQVVSGASLVFSMLYSKSLFSLMVAYFVPYIVMRIGASFYVRRRLVENTNSDKGLFIYGRSMTLFQIISRLISSIDQIVLYHFLGPIQVAIFALATAVPNRVQSVLRITGTLAFPKFANRTAQEITHSLPRKMFLFGLGILVVCGVYILAAPLMFTYIFPKYLPSLHFSQVAIFYTLSSITYPFGSYLFAHKKVQENYLIAVGSFIPKFLCLIILVPRIGVWGAIIGLVATSLATIGISIYLLIRDRRANTDTVSVSQ